MKKIDLNSDLGEWSNEKEAARDVAIMPFISSCNIACGGHSGDKNTLKATFALCKEFGVAAGAHPSFPDRENFGRKVMNLSPHELEASIRTQLDLFLELASATGVEMHHIKPHGALYNEAARNEEIASIMADLIKAEYPGIPVYLPPESVSIHVFKNRDIPVVNEVFSDRRYEDNYELRSRSFDDALIKDEEEVLEQIAGFVFHQKVKTVTEKHLPISAETICLHSDTPGSMLLAKSINEFLTNHDITITAP